MNRFLRRIPCFLIAPTMVIIGLGADRSVSASPQSPPQRSEALIGSPASPGSLAFLHRVVSDAEDTLRETRRTLRKARQRRYPRGQALEALRQRERDDAAALVQAEDDFLLRVAQARREEAETREWATFVGHAEEIEEARRLASDAR